MDRTADVWGYVSTILVTNLEALAGAFETGVLVRSARENALRLAAGRPVG